MKERIEVVKSSADTKFGKRGTIRVLFFGALLAVAFSLIPNAPAMVPAAHLFQQHTNGLLCRALTCKR